MPDRILGADISQACKKHDTNYANGMNKVQADLRLVKDVYKDCVKGGVSPLICGPTAIVYGLGVTVGGHGAYPGAN